MRGYTLLELLVSMAVAGVVLAFAVPGMVTMVQNGRESAQVSSLIYSLDLARSEAIKRDSWVQVCATSDGKTCDPNATTWNNGWLVVNAPSQTAAYPALLVMPALAGGNTLTASQKTGGGAVVSSVPAVVQFEGNGTLSSVLPMTVTFQLCDSRGGSFARSVSVKQLGRVVASPNIGYSVEPPYTALTCP